MANAKVVAMTTVTMVIHIVAMANGQPGILYPRSSESRTVLTLDGMWRFRVDDSPTRNAGFDQQWWSQPLKQTGDVIPMPVPSSYNDITTDASLRDFVGWAWYETDFFVSQLWQDKLVYLRFGSAHYTTQVWVNEVNVMSHDGGHLPFEADIGQALAWTGGSNRLTVAVNNTLTPLTLPPGSIVHESSSGYPPGYFVQKLQMDFFNYAGIHRHVHLYTKPTINVDDIDIVTDIKGTDGVVNYTISVANNGGKAVQASIRILDATGKAVVNSSRLTDHVVIPSVTPWWPWTMTNGTAVAGYMYTLEVTLQTENSDVYRQPFGVRTVSVTSSGLFINGSPFYCQGVAKHEDSDIRGKGLDYPLIARDFAMLKWLGVNCFRTSHYPYAEEILDQADAQGIAVIDESPGVGIQSRNMGPENVMHHKEVMAELVKRDKNRPSVIMWSVANEPESDAIGADHYFQAVIEETRNRDPAKRPVTFVSDKDYNSDRAVKYVDVICFNRYYGWYQDTGHLEVIKYQLTNDLNNWRKAYPTKPLIITEYGADTVAGLHTEPSFVFTEDYQVDFMSEYHKVFDVYHTQYLTGEMVWNFADFMTTQSPTRVVGNKKGVLTRQRQPKASGHLLRDRYHSMFNSTYTSNRYNRHRAFVHVKQEL